MRDHTLEQIFSAHRRELNAYLVDKLKDADVAADLTQEAFLRFIEQCSPQVGTIRNARAYLYRIVHNLAVDHVRRRTRRKTEAAEPDEMANIADDAPSQEDAADARQRLDLLKAVLSELPERTQTIFRLHRVEGHSYAETARILGVSESSVQKHLTKALLHVMSRIRPQ